MKRNDKPLCNPPLFILSSFLLAMAFVGSANAADILFRNAVIYTVNDIQPSATAVAIEDGKIVFVGGNADSEKYIDESTEVIDLQGQMLLPGFIDTHNHVFEGASDIGGGCELSRDRTLSGQKKFLQACKDSITRPGEWVIGYGHQLDTLLQNNSNPNPRKYLDKYFPENPVVIMEESSHSMLVNSLALERADIDKNTPNPQGGTILFADDNSGPNGILFDNAGDIVMELAWNSFSEKFQVSYDGLIAGMEEAVSNGITTIGDGRLYWQRGWYEVWQEARKNDQVIVRTSLRPWIYPEVEFTKQLDYLDDIFDNNIESLLIVNQVKMYIDGVLHFGTAKVLEPYRESWQDNLPYGLNYIQPKVLSSLFKKLDKFGYGAHVHAIGDGGVREVLDAIELVRESGSNNIYSMTHLELVDPIDYPRFNKLNVHADFQAGASYFDKTSWASFYIGSQKAKRMMPMRELYNTGANITFSSDWTVNPINPLVAIANSLRLRDSKGLPDIHTAIRAATINGARALGLESITGSIEEGKSADFVVLSDDITRMKPGAIRNTEVVLTMLQGEVVYDARR